MQRGKVQREKSGESMTSETKERQKAQRECIANAIGETQTPSEDAGYEIELT